ncbi:MAG: ZIP family metal transporter [Kiritimatiellia bacterium]
MLPVLLSVGGSTVLGVFGGLLVRRVPRRFNDAVLGYAAGVMLAAAVLGLLAPAFAPPGAANLALALAGAAAGAGLISVLDRIVPHLHRLAGLDAEAHRNNRSIGRTLLFVSAIALHKIPEGLATGVSFGAGSVGDLLTVAGAISLQNVPEAVVIVAPLVAVGVSTCRVVGISFAIAALSMASVVCGSLLVAVFSSVLPFMLAAAGGAMLYVVSDEMIPETHSCGHEKLATFALIAGLLTVVVLQRFFAA